jgi:hypothetical protein
MSDPANRSLHARPMGAANGGAIYRYAPWGNAELSTTAPREDGIVRKAGR